MLGLCGVVFCCVAARCGVLFCVLWWCVAPLLVGRAASGCGVLCCVALCCVWWCVTPHIVGRAALGCCPSLGGAVLRCVVGCGVGSVVLCGVVLCVVPLLVRRAAFGCGVLCFSTLCGVVVCGPLDGGACRGGVWPPSWWGCVALCSVVSRHVAVCCVVQCGGVWPPSRRGVLPRCVAPTLEGRGSLGCGVLCCGAFCCVWSWCVAPFMVGRAALGCGVLCCVVLCRVRRCVATCMVGRAALVFGPPHGGACCAGVFWFWRVVFLSLVARLVSSVQCCLRHLAAGVVGCCVSVVFAWPGQTGPPPERVWCATLLSWPGRTGRPPERVRCATPCFCFAGVFTLPLVFPCSPTASLCLRGSFPCCAVWRRLLQRLSSYPIPTLRLLSSATSWPLGVARPAGGCCPPPPPPQGFSFSGRWRFGPRFSVSSLSSLCLLVALRRLAVCWRRLLTPPSPGFVFRGCRRPAACLPLFSSAFSCAAGPFAPPPLGFCVSGSSCCCLVPTGVGALCWLVLCFAVLCCCLLCCVVRGAVRRALPCRVLLCFADGVVLRCVSSCGFALLRALPCAVALCCVVVHCGVRWGAASCCSVLCCPAVCCCGVLCAVWCPLALCCWLCAVLCCAVLCGAALLFAAVCCAAPLGVVSGCAALCRPRCGLLFRPGRGAVCCAVPPGAVLGRVASCCAVWCRAVMHCAVGLVLRCVVSRCVVPWRAFGCCAEPRVLCALLLAVLCCCVLCCALGCGVLVRCAVLFVLSLAVLSGSVFLCVVLCLSVFCCAALRRVVSCGAVLLRTVLLAWCCAGSSRACWCCCVLCSALGCCAVLSGAVPFGVALCCAALCCVRCAVCVWPLCCGVCCFLLLSVALLPPCGIALCARLPLCIFKNRKTVSCLHVLCPVVSCRVLPALPARNITTN